MSLNKEIYRVILLLAAAVAIDFAFPVSRVPEVTQYAENSVAAADIIAPVSFPVYKSEEELTRGRNEAAGAVSPIFDLVPELADSSIARVHAFFDAIDSAASGAELEIDRFRAVRAVLEERGFPAPEAGASVLASDETRRRLREAITEAFDEDLRAGVASSGDLGSIAADVVVLRRDTAETFVSRDELPTMQRFYQQAASRAPSGVGGEARRLYHTLLVRFAEATIGLDQEATDAARAQARQAVESVKYEVLEGEIIVRAHERVGPGEVERLRALEAQLAASDGRPSWPARIGGLLFNLMLLLVFGIVLKFYRPWIYASDRSVTLIWVLFLAVAVAAALISRAAWPPELIPIAFAALVIASLYDGLLALLAVFVLVGLMVGRPPIQLVVLFPMLMGGAAAALSGRVVRRRAYTWASASVIALAYVLTALYLALITRESFLWMLESSFWGTLNAAGSTVLAAGIMPLAESFTKLTTDQSLLELADLNRPLLRRLSLEAPGTYAHSINVANLAEAAAREINADSLLTRVGVYYHDIGKVKKPQYYVENQPRGRNPHDKLKPLTSANIVRGHVKDGVELAEEAGVPDSVKAFILEHHGTQKIGFFWDRAKELDSNDELGEKDFRYAGPKPGSKETAIALLADSVESAARVLQDPTPESIAELVDRIVDYKMSDGQLDDAPLTLKEITATKRQFVKVLTGMYHHRLDYPPQNHDAAKTEHLEGYRAP